MLEKWKIIFSREIFHFDQKMGGNWGILIGVIGVLVNFLFNFLGRKKRPFVLKKVKL